MLCSMPTFVHEDHAHALRICTNQFALNAYDAVHLVSADDNQWCSYATPYDDRCFAKEVLSVRGCSIQLMQVNDPAYRS